MGDKVTGRPDSVRCCWLVLGTGSSGMPDAAEAAPPIATPPTKMAAATQLPSAYFTRAPFIERHVAAHPDTLADLGRCFAHSQWVEPIALV